MRRAEQISYMISSGALARSIQSTNIDQSTRINWKDYNPPDKDWLEKLAQFFHENDLSGTEKILINLKRHTQIHENPPSPTAIGIITRLKTIYAILLKKVTPGSAGLNFDPNDENVVRGIVTNIVEGLENCSDGMSERVTTVCSRWETENSFHGLLCKFRTEIIDNTARAHFHMDEVGPGMETHRVNFYRVMANQWKPGMALGAEEDKHYSPRKTDEDAIKKFKIQDGKWVVENIEEAILARYTPLGVLQYIEDHIKQTTPAAPEKEEDQNELDYWRKLKDHNELLEPIAKNLCDRLGCSDTIDYTTLLLFEDRIIQEVPEERIRVYTGIDWKKVRSVIQEQLFNTAILARPTKKPIDMERQEIKEIFLPDVKNKSEVEYWSRITNDQDIKYFYQSLSSDKKILLLKKIYTTQGGKLKLEQLDLKKNMGTLENDSIKKISDVHNTDDIFKIISDDFFKQVLLQADLGIIQSAIVEIDKAMNKIHETGSSQYYETAYKTLAEKLVIVILNGLKTRKDEDREKIINQLVKFQMIAKTISTNPVLFSALFDACDPAEWKNLIKKLHEDIIPRYQVSFGVQVPIDTMRETLKQFNKENRGKFCAFLEENQHISRRVLSTYLSSLPPSLTEFLEILKFFDSEGQVERIRYILSHSIEEPYKDFLEKVHENPDIFKKFFDSLTAETQKTLLSNDAIAEEILFTGNVRDSLYTANIASVLRTPEIRYLFLKQIEKKFGVFFKNTEARQENIKFKELKYLLNIVNGKNQEEAIQFVFQVYDQKERVISWIKPIELVFLLSTYPSLVTQFFSNEKIVLPEGQFSFSEKTAEKLRICIDFLTTDQLSALLKSLSQENRSFLLNTTQVKQHLSIMLSKELTLLPLLPLSFILGDPILKNSIQRYIIEDKHTVQEITEMILGGNSSITLEQVTPLFINATDGVKTPLSGLLNEPLFQSVKSMNDFFAMLNTLYPNNIERADQLNILCNSDQASSFFNYLKKLLEASKDDNIYETLIQNIPKEKLIYVLEKPKDAGVLADILRAFSSSDNRESFLTTFDFSDQDLDKLIRNNPKHLIHLLETLPKSRAETLIKKILEIFPTWFIENMWERPCQELASVLKILPTDNESRSELIAACGGINAVAKKAYNVDDWINVTRQLKDHSDIEYENVKHIISIPGNIYALLNNTDKAHYPRLKNCWEECIKTNHDFLNAVREIQNPEKKRAFIFAIEAMSKKYLLENNQEILNDVLVQFDLENQKIVVNMLGGIRTLFKNFESIAEKITSQTLQATLQNLFLLSTHVSSTEQHSPNVQKNSVFEIAAGLSILPNDLEKSKLIAKFGDIQSIAPLVKNLDELAELLEHFPEEKTYQIKQLTEENQHNLEKNTVYVFYDKNTAEYSYFVLSPDGKTRYQGDIDDPIDITDEQWIIKPDNCDKIIRAAQSNRNIATTTSKAMLIEKIGDAAQIIEWSKQDKDITTLAQILKFYPESKRSALFDAINNQVDPHLKQTWEQAKKMNEPKVEKQPQKNSPTAPSFFKFFQKKPPEIEKKPDSLKQPHK